MPFSAVDALHMARALRLAERGLWTTAPNPAVGCVLVQPGSGGATAGEVVGEGWHMQAGGPHAEVHALRVAGERARGATAYVTLEPCNHHGRTPPCVDALISAGVARVVAAMVDPDPRTAGQGLARLRAAGIVAESGLMAGEADVLNCGFLSRVRRGRPFVIAKLAMSLDGRTALANGVSQWLTGEAARRDVHRLRARCQAIITGAGTAIADNPRLNVRLADADWPVHVERAVWRAPLRVVCDSQARLPAGSALLDTAIAPTLIAHAATRPGHWPASVADLRLAAAGADGSPPDNTQSDNTPPDENRSAAPAGRARVDLPALLAELAARGVNTALVEAGARLAGAFLQADLVDEWVIYQSSQLLGTAARGLVELPELRRLQDCPHLLLLDERRIGEDRRLVFGRRP